MTEAGPEAVLIIGLYGSGKSSVAAEMADLLEDLTIDNDRPIREVAADIVRWLGWV